MLKVKVTAGGNGFEIETDAPLSDVSKYLDLWFMVISPFPDDAQNRVDELTARVRAANDALQIDIDRNTPPTP